MKAGPLENSPEPVASLERRLEDQERWVRILDGQVRILDRERQKLSAIVGHADAGFLVLDPALRVVWANAYLDRFLGEAASARVMGAACHGVLCRESAPCASCPAARTFRMQKVAHHEVTLDLDGTPRTIYATAMPILSPAGRVEQTMVMVQDVSDLEVLRRSEQHLRESESRLRLLVEQMPALMWSTDLNLRFTSSVGSALAHLGLTPNEVVGRTLYEFFRTADRTFKPIAAHLRAVAGASVSYEMEWEGRAFETYVEPLLSEDRTIIGSVGLALDVTERKHAEEAQRQSEARKHSILGTSLDAIVIMDHEGKITEFNPAAEAMFGWARSEAMGRSLAETVIPSRFRAQHREGLAHYLASGEGRVIGRRIESQAIRKDGSEFPVEIAITRIPLGGPASFTGTIRDLTERKQAERALREREEQLRHSQKMEAIGTLAGGVAHDFNNILTAILGYTAILRRGAEPGGEIARAATIMDTAARRGAALTQQLLGFARKGKNQNVAVDLGATIEEVIVLLRSTLDKNIVIVHTSALPTAFVFGDPGQIQQVILNLAVNARDAMPDGGEMTLATDAVVVTDGDRPGQPAVPPGEYVRLSITDTGCGMADEVRARIFEPFFTTKALGKGTGMGLAMVYGIVQNHGGSIAVRSEPERGSTFEVWLPRAAQATEGEAVRVRGRAVRGSGRILVVDDEDMVRDVAADLLRDLGYDVVTACDGAEAVRHYERHFEEIDVVLLDLAMPKMDGRECFRALKAIDPGTKAILCTGYGFNIAAQNLLDEGMLAVVPKPYEIEQLSDAVSRALRAPRGERS
ncbi:MAG TPA: PAS domain S-box protein [Candidatus Polarisedimenticolaceae bacterium]|nr:PAS domain S-box protein [Candidatus Polarisedimenticolaceae bacterium]